VRITEKRLACIRKSLPQKPDEKRKFLLSRLNQELTNKMMRSHRLVLFEEIAMTDRVDAKLVATTLEETLVSLRRDGVQVEKINDAMLRNLFRELGKGLFVKAAIPDILTHLAKKQDSTVAGAVKELKLQKISGAELRKLVEKEGKDMRKLMAKYRLRVDAKELAPLLR